ncbi:hypothetical protein [Pseudoxanthomonas broegbernensis]|uniref:hypothetical protein n=1 Tax=Pseudoxanthomonas broegbernensis TaxID=83619 RepID=UPI001392070A|nr:hypothetical protein [Pseudoxanthomonas broegbernensis]MBB6066461.1 hypothetical protein [Pseudoxanthomonas broegbernensis]
MQDPNKPLAIVLSLTRRLLLQFIGLVAVISLVCVALYLWSGNPKLLWVVVVAIYALALFSAPISASIARAQQGLTWLSRSWAKVLAFCLVWSGTVAALFIATLQFGQGMETSAFDYFAIIAAGGMIGVVVACIPVGR